MQAFERLVAWSSELVLEEVVLKVLVGFRIWITHSGKGSAVHDT